jgi:PTS system ascorbate-specific IIB component
MDKKFHALVCCRAGMGSSMMLKIKCDQVIKEDNLPIETEHGNLDSLIGGWYRFSVPFSLGCKG